MDLEAREIERRIFSGEEGISLEHLLRLALREGKIKLKARRFDRVALPLGNLCIGFNIIEGYDLFVKMMAQINASLGKYVMTIKDENGNISAVHFHTFKHWAYSEFPYLSCFVDQYGNNCARFQYQIGESNPSIVNELITMAEKELGL